MSANLVAASAAGGQMAEHRGHWQAWRPPTNCVNSTRHRSHFHPSSLKPQSISFPPKLRVGRQKRGVEKFQPVICIELPIQGRTCFDLNGGRFCCSARKIGDAIHIRAAAPRIYLGMHENRSFFFVVFQEMLFCAGARSGRNTQFS